MNSSPNGFLRTLRRRIDNLISRRMVVCTIVRKTLMKEVDMEMYNSQHHVLHSVCNINSYIALCADMLAGNLRPICQMKTLS